MKITRRRRRSPDPLASAAAVREVLAELRTRVPNIPNDEKQIVSLLRAAIHAERSPDAASGRGRKSRWPARDLALATSGLRDILGRGTYGRKDARSYVEHYLRVLTFPADVREALERGDVNLFEAEQLARLTSRSLGVSTAQTRARRQRLLMTHLQTQESGARLRTRVNAVLAGPQTGASGAQASAYTPEILEATEALEAEIAGGPEAIEADPTSIFYDLLSTIAHALNNLNPDDLSADDQERVFEYGDKILLILKRAQNAKDR